MRMARQSCGRVHLAPEGSSKASPTPSTLPTFRAVSKVALKAFLDFLGVPMFVVTVRLFKGKDRGRWVEVVLKAIFKTAFPVQSVHLISFVVLKAFQRPPGQPSKQPYYLLNKESTTTPRSKQRCALNKSCFLYMKMTIYCNSEDQKKKVPWTKRFAWKNPFV